MGNCCCPEEKITDAECYDFSVEKEIGGDYQHLADSFLEYPTPRYEDTGLRVCIRCDGYGVINDKICDACDGNFVSDNPQYNRKLYTIYEL
jgi:hypothetical protein